MGRLADRRRRQPIDFQSIFNVASTLSLSPTLPRLLEPKRGTKQQLTKFPTVSFASSALLALSITYFVVVVVRFLKFVLHLNCYCFFCGFSVAVASQSQSLSLLLLLLLLYSSILVSPLGSTRDSLTHA